MNTGGFDKVNTFQMNKKSWAKLFSLGKKQTKKS